MICPECGSKLRFVLADTYVCENTDKDAAAWVIKKVE